MSRMQLAAQTHQNLLNMNDAIDHILWTVEHSPKAYAMFRQRCMGLRQHLVNAELRHRELEDG
jgi:hypothetical protein